MSMCTLITWSFTASWILLLGYSVIVVADDDSIDTAMVEEYDILTLSMPSYLNMTINMMAGRTLVPVKLALHMNKEMNEHRAVLVPRTFANGSQILMKQNIPIAGNIAFYQDKLSGAAVKVVCDGLNMGHCHPSMHGSFFMNKVEYGLEPQEGHSQSRKKRNAAKTKSKGRIYSIYKVKRASPSEYDFQPSVVGNNSAMQFSQREIDTGKLNFPLPGMAMTRIGSVRSRHQRSKLRKYYKMGVIVVIDFGIYQKWYRLSEKKTAAEKDIDAKFKIREYMAHVINGIDLRYKTLSNFEVDIVVTRYIIADSPSSSPWTARRFSSEPRDLVFADHALNELARWRYFMDTQLPKHDHTMLFTGYDLYRPTLANTGVAGFARVKSMCSPMSVSVVEEHGGFSSILTATHELGHRLSSLGAYHDGHNNTCNGQDNFIMTPIGGGTSSPSNSLNPFRFSKCSEEAFEEFLLSLPPNNCLTDEAEVYDQHEFREHIQTTAGQLYGPNDQCIQHLGSASYYAWGGILGETEDVCTHMACKNHQSNTSFNIYYAVRGTSCGDKRWCMDGLCTYSERAPSADDTCVHGDSWRKFGNTSCAEYVNEDPSRCYYSFYSRFCCASCQKLRKNLQDCEYGNRKKICSIVDTQPRFCYNRKNQKMCCESCKVKRKDIKGCEYGDRSLKCDLSKCNRPDYAKKCCQTCSILKTPQKKRRTPMTPDKQLNAAVTPRKNHTKRPNVNKDNIHPKPKTNGILANLKPEPVVQNNIQVPVQNPIRQTRTNTETRFNQQDNILADNIQHNTRQKDPRISSNFGEQKSSFVEQNNFRPQTQIIQHNGIPTRIFPLRDHTTRMCVKQNANYYTLSCSWLAQWVKSLCSQPVMGVWCCERCLTTMTPEAVCIDRIGCNAKSGVDCYNNEERERCCSTCRNFQTGIPDCPYGNRGKHCEIFMRFIPQQTCRVLKNNCCYSCRNQQATNSFQETNSFTNNNFQTNNFQTNNNNFQTNNNNFGNLGTRNIFERRSQISPNREQFQSFRPLMSSNQISHSRSLQRRLGGGRNLIRWS